MKTTMERDAIMSVQNTRLIPMTAFIWQLDEWYDEAQQPMSVCHSFDCGGPVSFCSRQAIVHRRVFAERELREEVLSDSDWSNNIRSDFGYGIMVRDGRLYNWYAVNCSWSSGWHIQRR